MRRILLFAVLPLALGGMPAGAAGGDVLLDATAIARPTGGGYLLIAVCEATAVPDPVNNTADVPLSTSVSCSGNGVNDGRTVPGGKAVAVVVNATTAPMQVCIGGAANFLQSSPPASYNVAKAVTCSPVGPA